MQHKGILAAGALVVVVLAIAGLVAFQPWKLWVDQKSDDTAPVSGATSQGGGNPGTGEAAAQTLFEGRTWRSYSHGETTGTVRVYRIANGSQVLRLEDLHTSNGPDVKVVLSERPHDTVGNLAPGYLNLGTLKGNEGSSNYAIPAGTDLNKYKSVVIWCKRFDAVFAAAPISRSTG
jgi:hypothetical protein